MFDWPGFFLTGSEHSNYVFCVFVLWVLSLSKNHEAKMSKNWILLRPSWIFWRPSWINNGHLISLYSIYGNNNFILFHFVIKVQKLVQMIDIKYMLNKYPFSIQDGRQKFKMAATKFSFLTFPHQTAVISRASSRSPCFFFFSSVWRKKNWHLSPPSFRTFCTLSKMSIIMEGP